MGKEIENLLEEMEKNLLCRKCKKEMEKLFLNFDVMSIFNEIYYCDNPDCEWYGVVVVAGLENKLKEN